MDDFYKLGCDAAFEKYGQGMLAGLGARASGLLGRAGEAWGGLAPATQGLVKRLGVGGAAGGALGGLTAEEGEGGRGALLGGLLGAGSLAGAGALARRSLRGGVAHQMRGAARGSRLAGYPGAPAARIVRQEMTPLLQRAESQLIPSISPQAREEAARRIWERL